MTDDDLETERLNVARTRPAMRFGIPWLLIVPVSITCLEINFLFGIKPALYVDPAIIVVTLGIVRKDHNAFRLWAVWLQTKALCCDRWFYGGAAVAPFPIKPSKHPRGVPSDAW